jgi:hypothetical protein
MNIMRKVLPYYPVISTVAFELSTIGQIARMVRESSALGQEPISWLLCVLGLVGWAYWYRQMTPQHPVPFYTALLGAGCNSIALFITIYYRWIGA